MTEYEWEAGRLPRPPDLRVVGSSGRGPIADYVALEFPRESIAWVVNIGPALPNRKKLGPR